MTDSKKKELQNDWREKSMLRTGLKNGSHKNDCANETSISRAISKPRTESKSSQKSSSQPLQAQQSMGHQQGQFDVYPVVTFLHSGRDVNISRTETLTGESQAVIANMALSNLAVDKNWNWLPLYEALQRSEDSEQGYLVEGPTSGRARSPQVRFLETTRARAGQPLGSGDRSQEGVFLTPGENYQFTRPLFSYKDQELVEIKVVFVRVFDVDTIRQKFEAEFYIQARWTESQFAGFSQQLEKIEFSQCWDPMLTILNTAGKLEKDTASILLRYEPEKVHPMLTYMWRIHGVFREPMELQHFPFDVQVVGMSYTVPYGAGEGKVAKHDADDISFKRAIRSRNIRALTEISIVLSSERTVKEIELVCDYSQISNVDPRALQGNQEWTAYRHVEFTRDYNTVETLSTTKYPVLVASGHVKRRLGYYLWNIVLIVILILSMSFTILGIQAKSGSRLQITSTLFLSCIAFKLVVKNSLPNVAYLTYLDMYVIFALVFLVLQAVENSIMLHLGKFLDSNTVEIYDEVAQFCLLVIFIAFHLAFIIHIQYMAFSRRRSMSDKELDFEIAKINLKKKKEEEKSKEENFLTENQLFKQTQTSDTLLSTLSENNGPVEVQNPLFRKA